MYNGPPRYPQIPPREPHAYMRAHFWKKRKQKVAKVLALHTLRTTPGTHWFLGTFECTLDTNTYLQIRVSI